MSYGDKIWQYLQKYGSITAKGIEQVTGTTCPHSVIRDIRKKYGYDCLTFEDKVKVKTEVIDGKEVKRRMQYREWFIRKLEG